MLGTVTTFRRPLHNPPCGPILLLCRVSIALSLRTKVMDKQQSNSRREFVKKAAYVAPAILSLAVAPSYAKAGSGNEEAKDKKEKKDKKVKDVKVK